jgi:hypothetical protein
MIGYLLLSIHAFLAARVMGELRLSYLGGGPTELRLLLIGITLAMLGFGTGPGWFGAVSGLDIFGVRAPSCCSCCSWSSRWQAGRILMQRGD